MKEILLAYAAIQLISTAYGLSVIGSVKPLIEEKLRDKGYVIKNKNSLYQFNESLGNFFKGLIPFYYAIKAITLVQGKDPVDRAVNEEIHNGKYISREEQDSIKAQEELQKELNKLKVSVDPQIMFEKPDKYVAHKNDISLYDTYETPIEYISRESTQEETFEPTPFIAPVNQTPTIVHEEVTKSDIAKALSELEPYELEALSQKMDTLASMKRKNKRLILEKDVA